jgi:hypothetical protein
MDGNGQHSRVTDDDLVNTLGRRIPVESRLDISGQNCANVEQMFEEANGLFLTPFLTVGADKLVALAVMSDTQGDFCRQDFKKAGYLNTGAVRQLVGVKRPAVIEVSREEQTSGSLDDFTDLFHRWYRLSVHVREQPWISAGGNQLGGDGRQLISDLCADFKGQAAGL